MRQLILLLTIASVVVAVGAAGAAAEDLQSADVGVKVTADKNSYKIGELVTFTLTVADYGEASAKDAVVKDVLPVGLALVSVSPLTPAPWSVDGAQADLGLDSQCQTSTVDASYGDLTGNDAGPFTGRFMVSCVLGDLASSIYSPASDTTATVMIVARATTTGGVLDDASVSAANPDPAETNNYAFAPIAVS
jgi:uncharacterized repeat protein (TIGR01451 family)